MATAAHVMTAADLEQLPNDGRRYRLLQGALIELAPAGDDHGRLISHLSIPLGLFVARNRLGASYAAETGFLLAREPDTVQGADLAFVRRERVRPFASRLPGDRYFPGAPDLAVEVVSANDRYSDVNDKVRTWLTHGAQVVLVIDLWRRSVDIHRATDEPSRRDARTLSETEQLTIPELFPGWSLSVASLFADEPDF